jgi:hypothetical protein
MPLTDTAVRQAKPGQKPIKLYDGQGMFVLVTPAGGKWWRFRYRFDGKEKLLSLGTYPDISLKDARERREAARKLIAQGIDPGAERKAEKAAVAALAGNCFESICREWLEQRKSVGGRGAARQDAGTDAERCLPLAGGKADHRDIRTRRAGGTAAHR